MKKLWIKGLLLGACAALLGSVPAMADSRKVVTLGADLTQEQKDTIMRYFGVSYDAVDVLTITNQDERDHLGSYVPLEQIGTHTYSCALVAPTSTGGIQVKTANLTWVTCNMIASTLSTSGVTNCQVVAACPFKVSGTGALTGIIMAYEDASEQPLDPVKVDLANQELVTTGNLSNSVGQSKATAIINETKTQVIENNVTDITEITNIVNEVSNNYDVVIDTDESDEIAQLMQKIAEQEYDIIQLKATLDRVQANVAGDAGATQEEQKAAEEQAQASEQAALEAAMAEQGQTEGQQPSSEEQPQDGVVILDGQIPEAPAEQDSILDNTDPSALEAMGGGDIQESDTTTTVQEQSEQAAQSEQQTDVWDGWDVDTGSVEDPQGGEAAQTDPAAGGMEESTPQDGGVDLMLPPEGGVEIIPQENGETSEPQENGEASEPQDGGIDLMLPPEGGVEITPQGDEGEAMPQETEATAPEGETEDALQGISEEMLEDADKENYDAIKEAFGKLFVDGMVSNEDEGKQVYLTEEAEKQIPEKIQQYVLKVMTLGVEAVDEMEKSDPTISQTIVEDTSEQEPDALYEDEQLVQIDKYVRRLILTDAEEVLKDCELEVGDAEFLYEQIMAVFEEVYEVEDPEQEVDQDFGDPAQISDELPADEAEGQDAVWDESVDGASDTLEVNDGESLDVADEFADFDEETGEF